MLAADSPLTRRRLYRDPAVERGGPVRTTVAAMGNDASQLDEILATANPRSYRDRANVILNEEARGAWPG